MPKFFGSNLGVLVACVLLSSCGSNDPDCSTKDMHNTVYKIMKSEKLLTAVLLGASNVKDKPFAVAAVSQWLGYATVAADWSNQEPKFRAELEKDKRKLADNEQTPQRLAELRAKQRNDEARCRAEYHLSNRIPQACADADGDRVEIGSLSSWHGATAENELKKRIANLEATLSGERDQVNDVGDLVAIEFTQVNEDGRSGVDNKTIACRGIASVKLIGLHPADLGAENVRFDMSPNLVGKDSGYTVRVWIDQ